MARAKVTSTLNDTIKGQAVVSSLEKLKRRAEGWVEVYTIRCAEWAIKFNKNPYDALDWSDRTFEHAARLAVAQQVLESIAQFEDKKDHDNTETAAALLIEALKRDALSQARWPQRSTSIVSNEAHTYLTAALVEFTSDISTGAYS